MSIREWLVRRPYAFIALAILELALGVGICTWLVVRFANDVDQTEFENRGALILGVLLIVLGVETSFLGLVALVFRRRSHLDDQR